MQNIRLQKLPRFIISGGAATFAHFLTMGVLIYFGTEATIATAVGAIVGAVLNYLLQYHFTFQSSRKHLHSVISYTGASGLAWVSNLILFILFSGSMGMSIVFSQLAATAIVTIQNYFVYNRVFNKS